MDGRRPTRFSAVLLALLLLPIASNLSAREVEVFVEDVELNLPLEGAVVRLPDGRQYVCDRDGRAAFSVPEGAQMLIQVSYPGYETARLVITPGQNRFTVGLWLSGVMEGRELVVEAARPGGGETVTGRSVAVAGREIAQTAEIGIVEDVMAAIRLLPGVGYTGMFNAQPSIRGGDPGDMRAALDGFYVFNPFHWGGGFSIFDPRMVESAQLSHGVFSVRYGHTISGLLDIRTRSPSPTEVKLETGASSSAASFGLSLPLGGRGGVLFMGRVTYYDPVIWLAQRLSGPFPRLDAVNFIRVAPYIRSGTVTGSYRLSDRLEFGGTAFWGADGVGAHFEDDVNGEGGGIGISRVSAELDYVNRQGFATGRLAWNPRNDMLLRVVAGIGHMSMAVDGEMEMTTHSDSPFGGTLPVRHTTRDSVRQTDRMFNVQGRVDFDWDMGRGLLVAAGVQEKTGRFRQTGVQDIRWQRWLSSFDEDDQNEIRDAMLASLPPGIPLPPPDQIMVSIPITHNPDAANTVFSTSGYVLAEYRTPGGRMSAEVGLRLDRYRVVGTGFSAGTTPALNPRAHFDFNVLRNRGILESLNVTLGTGLFASMNNALFSAEQHFRMDGLRPNRSWSSVAGTRLEFAEGLSLNLEAYYRHIFNRMYVPIGFTAEGEPYVRPRFDGRGRVWGIDLMLRRTQSRRVDGWLSYSFNWTRLLDPYGGNAAMGISGGTRRGWHFPSYHRFHNLNLVLNFRPAPRFNIYTRFGLASGVQLSRREGVPQSFPVFVHTPGEEGHFVLRYFWPSRPDENNRTSPSLPMDVKFSLFGGNTGGRGMARWEMYFAVENVLGLLSSQLGLSQGNTGFDPFTGRVNQGVHAATYQIPIPIPSFGFRITF